MNEKNEDSKTKFAYQLMELAETYKLSWDFGDAVSKAVPGRTQKDINNIKWAAQDAHQKLIGEDTKPSQVPGIFEGLVKRLIEINGEDKSTEWGSNIKTKEAGQEKSFSKKIREQSSSSDRAR